MKATRVDDLFVYKAAYEIALVVFDQSQAWPAHERHALTAQVRRSSRSVCANLAEAWAKRRYLAHFISKLTDAQAEAQETLTWLSFARDCGYLSPSSADELASQCHRVIAGVVTMIRTAPSWDPTSTA